MIRSFKHRGLKRLYEHGDRSRLRSDNINRIEDILARLDVSLTPFDLDLPGYALHALKGDDFVKVINALRAERPNQ